jgi:hypothetical protein
MPAPPLASTRLGSRTGCGQKGGANRSILAWSRQPTQSMSSVSRSAPSIRAAPPRPGRRRQATANCENPTSVRRSTPPNDGAVLSEGLRRRLTRVNDQALFQVLNSVSQGRSGRHQRDRRRDRTPRQSTGGHAVDGFHPVDPVDKRLRTLNPQVQGSNPWGRLRSAGHGAGERGRVHRTGGAG